MRCLSVVKVGKRKNKALMFQAPVDFQGHLRRLLQQLDLTQPLCFTGKEVAVRLVDMGSGLLHVSSVTEHGRELDEVKVFLMSVWKDWNTRRVKAAEQEQEKQTDKNRFKGTLRLPKKPADPNRVQEVVKRINDKYGHVPNKQAETRH
jgi:hypothetical protein